MKSGEGPFAGPQELELHMNQLGLTTLHCDAIY